MRDPVQPRRQPAWLADALVAVLAEVPLVPAEVPVAWATAAACPASAPALVVWAGWLNGVNCVAAAEEPA